MVKRCLIVVAIAAALYFISNLVQGISYRRTTQGIITNRAPTLFDFILGYTDEILMFPPRRGEPEDSHAKQRAPAGRCSLGFVPRDCLFWAIVFYSIIGFISHYWGTQKRKSP
jgi:hypothetical protein